jgi:hypothetical protein
VLEEVPEDVSNTWIDELTIRQFNEELKGVFPYVYNLVKEANKVEEVDLEKLAEDDAIQLGTVGNKYLGMFKTHGADYLAQVLKMDKATFGKEMVKADGNPAKVIQNFLAQKGFQDTNDDMGSPNEVIDPQTAYAEKMDAIIAQSKHEQGPKEKQMMTAEEQQAMWEKFSQCAADAASKGEKEFMFAGKKYKTKMSKLNAEKILGKRTDELTAEDQQLQEALPLLGLLVPAAGAALRMLGPKVLPNVMKGSGKILSWSAKNPVKATVGATAAANPSATVDVAKGAVNTVKGGAELVGKANDAIDTAQSTIKSVGDKVANTADELKSMAAGALDNIPDLNKVAGIAKQYAIPAAVVVALLLGGYKVYKMMFGDDERAKEDDKDATTIDISPKGNGDELKQKNEIPLDEFIKGMYDYTSNAFPKGETAVLTAVQKQYGDEMVDEAQAVMADLLRLKDAEMARIQSLAGLR